MVGTVEIDDGETVVPADMTTPGAGGVGGVVFADEEEWGDALRDGGEQSSGTHQEPGGGD